MKGQTRGVVAPLIKLVIFLIVTTFATYVLGATIANASYGSTYTYKADFTDVSGLQPGDDVRIAGVRVGSISGVKIVNHDTAQVSFTVEKSRPLPTSVIAQLRYRNLVGQRYLDIEQGPGEDKHHAQARSGHPGDADPPRGRPHRPVPGIPAAVPGT